MYKQLAKKHKLSLLILFGSRAKKTHKSDSDYDIAFYTKKSLTINQEQSLFEDIMNLLKTEKIDLININKNYDPLLRNEIFQHGKCLYEETKYLFDKLKGDAWIDFIDFQPYYKKQSEILKNKIESL